MRFRSGCEKRDRGNSSAINDIISSRVRQQGSWMLTDWRRKWKYPRSEGLRLNKDGGGMCGKEARRLMLYSREKSAPSRTTDKLLAWKAMRLFLERGDFVTVSGISVLSQLMHGVETDAFTEDSDKGREVNKRVPWKEPWSTPAVTRQGWDLA